ncbi:MAG: DUF2804 domain-containing protein [Bacteroidales bacterium]|jgi:hypothetical protein|nr:DUF2804 domain-containing protein [Bacteroidales bacterium]
MNQQEIEKPAPVLNEKGLPINMGWAKKPLFHCEESMLWTPDRFCTASEKYVIFSNSSLFVFELCNCGNFGFLHVSAVSLLDKHIEAKTVTTPLYSGSFPLMSTNQKKTFSLHYKNNLVEFISMDNTTKIIKIDMSQIGRNRRLRGEVVLFEPFDAQSISTHSFWPNESRRLKIVRSSPWLIVEGVMQFENMDMAFNKTRAWGIHYCSRIVRPKNDFHFWAAGCGLQNGRQIGFNIGYGSDDSSFGTENAFFINGNIHKLEYVTMQFSPSSRLNPWLFSSNDNRLEMKFFPLQEHEYNTYFMTHTNKSHQVYGFFSGRIVTSEGYNIVFSRITGVIEQIKTRN